MLSEYLKQGLESKFAMVRSCNPKIRTYFLNLLTDSIIYRSGDKPNFNDFLWNVRPPSLSYEITFFEDMVFNLIQYDITHDLFGLSYNDVMNLDFATFAVIKRHVEEIAKRRTEQSKRTEEQMASEQKKLEKGLTYEQPK